MFESNNLTEFVKTSCGEWNLTEYEKDFQKWFGLPLLASRSANITPNIDQKRPSSKPT